MVLKVVSQCLSYFLGMSFLNVGSGTGYFSCLCGYMIKSHGINHGVELHEDLVEFARERVDSFLTNGPSEAQDIRKPLFLSGNCFQLDPHQMKYDRLYVGGACPQSKINFFLQFLKVGGYLIAPVGTKLIKLERVSANKGVKTSINMVCFAPLVLPEQSQFTNIRLGLVPLLKFPIKTKKERKQGSIFAAVNFPVSSSQSRRKLSRLRALQDALGMYIGYTIFY